jgi:hypothetical protein
MPKFNVGDRVIVGFKPAKADPNVPNQANGMFAGSTENHQTEAEHGAVVEVRERVNGDPEYIVAIDIKTTRKRLIAEANLTSE